MSRRSTLMGLAGGVLCANALPHLATAVTGRVLMTPLAGPRSPAWVNAVWGAANLAGGLAMTWGVARGRSQDSRLILFDVGVLACVTWAVTADHILELDFSGGSGADGPRGALDESD